MLLRTTLAALAAAAFMSGAAAQTGNLQGLLAALTQGTEVTLITHFANGTSQVTSFRPPVQLPPAEAAAAIERARAELAAFGVTQPSGEQLAVSLIGGTLDIPTGRTQLPGVVPKAAAGSAGAIRSQVVLTSALPQAMLAPQASGITAGITAAQIGQAMQQLAGLGIANPTPQQLHVALTGGVLTTPGGTVTLPGVLAAQAGGAPGVAAGAPGAAAGGTANPLPSPVVPQPGPSPIVPPLGPAPIVTPLPPGASPAFPSDTPGFPSSTPGLPAR